MLKFATPAPVAAVLDVPAGRIQVIAADRSDTTVEILPADPAKARDVKAAEQTTADFHDGTLRIAAAPVRNRVLGHPGSVEITVQLPAGSRVEATTAAVAFRGVGRLGDVTLEAAQATVKIDEADHARLTVHTGDITIGRLGGPADIHTQKGDLHITEATRGTVNLRTEHGDITIGAARHTSATLDAGTHYGRVHNTLNNADGPAAALTIRATTAYGDITARSH
ncbi:DUF4097 family beta strand repeat-containing protein [Streptomyces sp. NPDC048383]|uniref:DUF4097 family beta strand repeat-containing protein n=1 Tax=Streptomyces sp. NPDC048383 TaxID=3155386 RepID=UPI0034190FC0